MKIKTKMALIVSISGALLIVATMALSFRFVSKNIKSQESRLDEAVVHLVSHASLTALVSGDYDSLQGYIRSIVDNNEISMIAVADQKGQIVASTKDSFLGKTGAYLAASTDKGSVRLRAEPVNTQIGDYGTIYIEASTDFLASRMYSAKLTVLFFGAISLIIAIFVSLLCARWLERKIGRVSGAAQAISRGDWGARVDYEGNDEIGDLIKSFNEMAEAVQATHKEIELASSRLNNMYNLMPVMLFVLDMKGTVLSSNEYAQLTLGYKKKEMTGKNLFELYPTSDAEIIEGKIQQCLADTGCVVEWSAQKRSRGGKVLRVKEQARVEEIDGKVSILMSSQDVTREHILSGRLKQRARQDALTGLLNRRAFLASLEEAVAAPEHKGKPGALLYISLDNYYGAVGTSGDTAGDKMIRSAARAIAETANSFRLDCSIGRIAGPEFCVLLPRTSKETVLEIAEQMRHAVLKMENVWASRKLKTTASTGVALLSCTSSALGVMRVADAARYVAESSGKDRIYVSKNSKEESHVVQMRTNLARSVIYAIEDNHLNWHLSRTEALSDSARNLGGYDRFMISMASSEGEILKPSQFIPLCDLYGMTTEIDRWSMIQVLEHIAKTPDIDRRISVRLSAQSISDDRFLNFVIKKMDELGVGAEWLCLEVPEVIADEGARTSARLLETIQELGGWIILDNFGAGLTSLSYLRQMPIDMIKINPSLTRNMVSDPMDRELIEWIQGLASHWGIRTVVERADSPSRLNSFYKAGVDYAWCDSAVNEGLEALEEPVGVEHRRGMDADAPSGRFA